MKKIIIAVMGAVVVIGAGLGVYTQREQTPKKTDTKQHTRKHTKKSTYASVKNPKHLQQKLIRTRSYFRR
ncbi:Uncharacterised protein [Weissella viridescens]|uniref:Uncharacterized protein n=1 Tax=Weissella viridescens TaxID=1629 RepID=A0A380P7J1_WEIVI|nr:Uncharacterised protein [Weissella viridescens]